MATTSLEFSNLPLVEAVVRAVVRPPLDLGLGAWYAVAAALEDDFGPAAVADQLEPPLGQGPTVRRQQISGIVLEQGPSPLSLRIQNDLLASRWTRHIDNTYPRFEALSAALWAACDAVATQLPERAVPISVINMGYVNVVSLSDRSAEGAVERYLAPEVRPPLAAGCSVLDLNVGWRGSDGVELRVTLQQAQLELADDVRAAERAAPGMQPALVISTVAGVELAPNARPSAALVAVHDALQKAFPRIVTRDALDEWGYRP